MELKYLSVKNKYLNNKKIDFLKINNLNNNNFIGGTMSKRCRVLYCTDCKPGFTHYCRECNDRDSDHRSSDCPFKRDIKIKNSCILLINSNEEILLVHNKIKRSDRSDDYWMIPGGKIDRGETPEIAALREFYEETTIFLPSIDMSEYYDMHFPDGITRIFKVYHDLILPSRINTSETDDIQFININELVKIIQGRRDILKLRRNNITSFRDMINSGFLSSQESQKSKDCIIS
jgi:8-oxo-dGTP pyrophosphatase MutT (NUDIX family)